jgi:nitroreductase
MADAALPTTTTVEPLLDLMRTTRAMRHFHPDPVPDAVIETMITAATYAPSGKNMQPWAFLAVRQAGLRRKIGDLYRDAWYEAMPPLLTEPPADRAEARARADWEYLANHMGDAPLLVLVCSSRPVDAGAGAGSIFPAIQNLLLVGRAHGVGGCLTTVHRGREAQIKDALNIPPEVETVALIPMGYPIRPFGPVRRRPVEDVLRWDRWRPDR